LIFFFTKFYKDFQEYTYKNKVLVAASGFTIGIATTDLLKSIITDIINPNIIKLVSSLSLISPLAIKYPFVFSIVKGFSNFIWLITIFVSFFVIEYMLNRKIIGLTSNVQDDEQKQFIKEKIISKEYNNILPNEKIKLIFKMIKN
jgi:large-conductance mechanosensitive channel